MNTKGQDIALSTFLTGYPLTYTFKEITENILSKWINKKFKEIPSADLREAISYLSIDIDEEMERTAKNSSRYKN